MVRSPQLSEIKGSPWHELATRFSEEAREDFAALRRAVSKGATPESRALLVQLKREPVDLPATGLIPDLKQLGFIEHRDSKWRPTRTGKDYLKTQR